MRPVYTRRALALHFEHVVWPAYDRWAGVCITFDDTAHPINYRKTVANIRAMCLDLSARGRVWQEKGEIERAKTAHGLCAAMATAVVEIYAVYPYDPAKSRFATMTTAREVLDAFGLDIEAEIVPPWEPWIITKYRGPYFRPKPVPWTGPAQQLSLFGEEARP